ncbi:hypothetical protein OEA41_003745 [Lepraria neglecta]|uniref:Cyclochlorotine biosynthesis protein O n=1 Tax=Lepraria neglecta TaxID=209136 RepID=A0AAD9Z590_9LECA|nr:hypothetical protein OEA41_003745 [Lepraria neglecta]
MVQEQEEEPFLPLKEYAQEPNTAHPSVDSVKGLSRWWAWRSQIFIHGALIALYTVLSVAAIRTHSNRPLAPRPAIDNLDSKYTRTIFHNLTGNPYAGPPSPEIDAAWSDLLAPMHIRVTKAELQRDNQDSVPLTEGGGYLGWMGVFHELHCVNMLRKWNYREYYHSDLSPEEEKHLGSHIDHCFEMLRQSAVCHADASLTTFKWHPAKTRPMFNASESVHSCVDWDILMTSVADRVVQEEEISRLDNPLMNGK